MGNRVHGPPRILDILGNETSSHTFSMLLLAKTLLYMYHDSRYVLLEFFMVQRLAFSTRLLIALLKKFHTSFYTFVFYGL